MLGFEIIASIVAKADPNSRSMANMRAIKDIQFAAEKFLLEDIEFVAKAKNTGMVIEKQAMSI